MSHYLFQHMRGYLPVPLSMLKPDAKFGFFVWKVASKGLPVTPCKFSGVISY